MARPASDRWVDMEEIGGGAYGVVFRARDRQHDNRVVALKRLRVQASDEGMPLNTIREIAILRRLVGFEHPNVVSLLDVCCSRRNDHEIRLLLVFEHVEMDLETFISNARAGGGVSIEDSRHISRQLLSGLDFLHSQCIVHRDLKPQNVLITGQQHVRIADFGLARLYTPETTLTQVVVTLWYRAPEILLHVSYHSAVDLWGAGCIIAEIFNGEPLFQGDREIAQLREIFKVLGVPPESDWPANTNVSRDSFENAPRMSMADIVPRAPPYAQELIKRLLEFSFEKRPTASAALKGPWFQPQGATSILQPQENRASSNSSTSTAEQTAQNCPSAASNPSNSNSANSENALTSSTNESGDQSTSSSARINSSIIGNTRSRESPLATQDETSIKRSRANT
ncbi:Oidioi.mRNA.OKI2018_I69.PAR.g12877.t1.cds [Oikopleura dioica]|uniref:Oidioi.mRNA.OKI2018_I69.PAR.g12877.t1.cds n=1 Tax=Oikopleura dioica TaxID=34765 RepID=A0ABN7S7I0_OIKDI|nr:Oidioi.mRNA.OKI2018_I69.PAR.g12877.t1.cds [Oikopleura dioica]